MCHFETLTKTDKTDTGMQASIVPSVRTQPRGEYFSRSECVRAVCLQIPVSQIWGIYKHT